MPCDRAFDTCHTTPSARPPFPGMSARRCSTSPDPRRCRRHRGAAHCSSTGSSCAASERAIPTLQMAQTAFNDYKPAGAATNADRATAAGSLSRDIWARRGPGRHRQHVFRLESPSPAGRGMWARRLDVRDCGRILILWNGEIALAPTRRFATIRCVWRARGLRRLWCSITLLLVAPPMRSWRSVRHSATMWQLSRLRCGVGQRGVKFKLDENLSPSLA